MTTQSGMTRTLITAACSVAVLAASAPVLAGVGGTDGAIRSAIRSGNPDAIVAQLEIAENIPCNSDCMYMVKDLLSHDTYEVREAAAWWFARRPAQRNALTAEMISVLQGSGDSVAVRNAADVLGSFRHPVAIDALASTAVRSDLSAEARLHAVRALGHIGADSANDALAQAMSDSAAQVRHEAVIAWRDIRLQRDAAPVAALVGDADLTVRRVATAVVGQFREASARAGLESLVVSDPDPAVRRNAAWALGRIGASDSRVALTEAASDSSSLVRMTARAALRELR
jgi:HEAT repeat protein